MCTISFLPCSAGSFLLATNRDEMRNRKEAEPPAIHTSGKTRVIRPVDGDAGGTWVALSEDGIAFAIMNEYQSTVRVDGPFTSRGKIIPAVADCKTTGDVSARLEMIHEFRFRPFRLLMADALNGVHMWQYDGTKIHEHRQGKGAGLWVSAGEKERQVLKGRKKLFERFLSQSGYDEPERIKELHTTREVRNDEYSFIVDLPEVHTVSAAIAECRSGNPARMHYMDAPLSPQKKWQTCTL